VFSTKTPFADRGSDPGRLISDFLCEPAALFGDPGLRKMKHDFGFRRPFSLGMQIE